MTPKSPPPPLKFSDITSKLDGKDLGDMCEIWCETAVSEERINLIADLKNKNLGFNEIEKFGLGLIYNFKSDKMKDQGEKEIKKVIRAAMEIKLRDETHH